MTADVTRDIIAKASSENLPLVKLEAFSSTKATVWMKQEWSDPDGPDPLRSIKRKPALFLFQDLADKSYLNVNQILLSATSGNFGIEIGMLAARTGIPFLAVCPAVVPEFNLRVMRALGINVIRTKEQDTCPREFTVFFARGYATEFHHRLVNVEQYYSFLNPLAHTLTTGPELAAGLNGGARTQPATVVLGVGSCGTVSGILQYFLAAGVNARVVGVQPEINQGIPGTHIIKGDCRWSPENYSPVLLPGAMIESVDQVDSYAFTAKLWDLGIPAGPSTGMALSQATRLVRQGAEGDVIVISPDSNFKYGDLLCDKLTTLKADIVARYPELGLKDAIGRYLSHLERNAGIEWTLKQVRECYPTSAEGGLFGVEDIEEIVRGKAKLAVARAGQA